MGDQIHIRDAEIVRLLRDAAKQSGSTITDILRDAVRSYRPRAGQGPQSQILEARELLEADRANLISDPGVIVDLYDDTGLPR